MRGVAIFSTRDTPATGRFRSECMGKLRVAESVVHENETGEAWARFVRLPGLRRSLSQSLASQYPIWISIEQGPSRLERLRECAHVSVVRPLDSELITLGNRNRQGKLEDRAPPRRTGDP